MKIQILLFLTLLVSCAHHKDVRPGVDGVHNVFIHSQDTAQGPREALSQANYFCEKRNKSAAIVKEETKYVGDMDEKSYNQTKRIGKVAQTIGSSAWVFGRNEVQDIGGLVGLGGTAVNTSLGNGYLTRMSFKCM